MKTVLILICIAATSSLCSSAAISRPSYDSAPQSSVSVAAWNESPPAAKLAHAKQSSLRGTVVNEMRATKAFVKETVVKHEAVDRALMLLAAFGMIALQLRRKHKSLPQRRIAPYA